MPAAMEALLLSALVITLVALVRLRQRSAELREAHRTLIQRNGELEAIAQARSRFLAHVSHELRNPLGAVLGFTELMQAGRLDPVTPRQSEHLEIVRDSAGHVLTLVDDLLELSGVQAGHLRLEPAPVEPATVVRSATSSLRTLARAKDVTVELDAPDIGVALVDPTRLRQVVLNYLSNAIKFTPAGGRISVRLTGEGNGLRLAVADTGPGIALADQERVFEEFFQVPGHERGGTGLGLAVTKLIVEAQGGTVQLHSRLGLGSSFVASLPTGELPPGALTPGVELGAAAVAQDVSA